ncbi:hypothetical protein [uncultured Jatrophihabitans sp.]|uniref:hypothetical protein n=1 Tax=uncultured Jatrophihabitans sp. TaxID=1610747 RepID=UPI0035C9FB57
MSNSDLALQALRDELDDLSNLKGKSPLVAETLSGKSKRKTFWMVMFAVIVMLAAIGCLLFYYLLVHVPSATHVRNQQHDDTQRQIRQLVCTVIPPDAGSPGAQAAYRQYDCAHFTMPRTP